MSEHVYKLLELTGSSTSRFQIIETRGHVEDGKVAHWQVTIKVGFTLE
jgi:flavin-binding protein dodecin